jgi:hypothetical protein
MNPIPLAGFVTLHDLDPFLRGIIREAGLQTRSRFVFDCAGVAGFSRAAVAELVKLQRTLRGDGGDLVLTHCRPDVAAMLADPQCLSLLADQPPRRDSKSLERREPYFLRFRGTRYQRFWMN